MLDEHRDKNWDFRRDIRHSKKSPILQKILALFECMVCTAYFHTYSDAVEHYLFIHKSHHADFKMIPLLKQMNRANEIKWLTSMKWDKLLQKHFMCLLCNNIQLTKCHLIRHHVKEHQSKELSITFIDRFTQYPHEAKLRNHKENLSFDQYLIYYCGHCVDLPFANVHDVYNHWRANHERADDVKPFRFVPAELAKCRYCDVIGTFQGLKDHQAKQHSAMHFVIENLLDRSKCGLCLADCSDSFSKHFENHHKSVLETNLFSPIVLSDYTVKKLRNIEEHKKRKCGHCTEIFETNDEFYKHHDTVHHPHNDISETFHDNESSHLICGCCNERLNRNVKLFDHFIEREIDSVEKSYWKTKVVFGNGLTLNKHNLLGTKLDDSYLINE
ncbi:uncharacterized protein LOC116348234 isoform X1 [Contarinia nasturtii]|uniref:uncharacterized protein LOC116348234 isoform X1 n=1 Tax=Contarinia nasturtii TaxID=265458 RepID=UPI0012D421C8|nr:uncharacterized protein LOC116348234 isoform X1 [Contarinia nasturtii]